MPEIQLKEKTSKKKHEEKKALSEWVSLEFQRAEPVLCQGELIKSKKWSMSEDFVKKKKLEYDEKYESYLVGGAKQQRRGCHRSRRDRKREWATPQRPYGHDDGERGDDQLFSMRQESGGNWNSSTKVMKPQQPLRRRERWNNIFHSLFYSLIELHMRVCWRCLHFEDEKSKRDLI